MFRVILAKNRAYILENIVDRLVFVVKTLSLCSVKAAADCTTSRKVAGSISDGVIGIFHWRNPSRRAIALGLTQPVTEMSTRNIF